MNPNQALWEKGDFTRIAAFMRESGEEVARAIGATEGTRVLDLGCGDGTTALPIARLGAQVVGIDIAGNLVEAARQRAAEENLDRLEFRHGDACKLADVDDDSFDQTVSMFGAMFAPKPFDVAQEMVRVTRPGGRITMGNWVPNDPDSFVSQLLKIGSDYLPAPPEGFVSPMTWGLEDHILERFARAGAPVAGISTVKDTYHFRSTDKRPEEFVELLERFYGPTMNAFEAAWQSQRGPEFHQRLVELAAAHNRSSNGGTAIPATYLRVTVQL
jgi:SAM-dependent methyltransferase